MTGSAAPRRGLGRGLEVLIGGGEPGGAELAQPPVDAIHANPRQPRRRFEPEATTGLASSIKQQGLLQPIVVRPRAAGRLRADRGRAALAGRAGGRVGAAAGTRARGGRPRHALLALVENVAREQLSPVEEARAYAALVDEFELSLGEVAERVGRSKPSVSNRLRLLELPEEVLWMVARGDLTEGHARGARPARPRGAQAACAADRPRRPLRASGGADRPRRRRGPQAPGGCEGRSRRSPNGRAGRGAPDRSAPARVSAGKLEIHFGEELRLEEPVEVLEAL